MAQATELGVGRSRLRARDLRSPFVGVRSESEPEDLPTLAAAYATEMSGHEFFSHATAAVLHGMWLPLELKCSGVLDVSVRKPARAPRDRDVRGHHLIDRPGLVILQDGLRVANPVETWCQLATQCRIPDLIAAGESLLTPDHREVELMLDRLIGAAGDEDRPMHVRLLRAAEALRPGVRSAKETELRLLIVGAGLPEPEINAVIEDEHGYRIAECDLVYRKQKVIIEYEGDGHRVDKAKFRSDIGRYDRLQDLGWRVIRVTQDDLLNPAALIARIRRALVRA